MREMKAVSAYQENTKSKQKNAFNLLQSFTLTSIVCSLVTKPFLSRNCGLPDLSYLMCNTSPCSCIWGSQGITLSNRMCPDQSPLAQLGWSGSAAGEILDHKSSVSYSIHPQWHVDDY